MTQLKADSLQLSHPGAPSVAHAYFIPPSVDIIVLKDTCAGKSALFRSMVGTSHDQ